MGIVLILGAAILLLWLDYFIAKQFEEAAHEKGYNGTCYFHLCFWCGIVGYLLVVALPDRGREKKKFPEQLPPL